MWRLLFAMKIRREVRNEFAFVRTFGRGFEDCDEKLEFASPSAVCVDDGNNIIVVDRLNDRIIIADRENGTLIRAFGTSGYDPGQFMSPWGVCVNSARHIIVADGAHPSEHRVQIFSCVGRFVRLFVPQCEFELHLRPMHFGVCVDGDDNIVVAYAVCVQVWSSDGTTVLRTFGTEGDDPGQFYYPRGVCVDGGGNVIVADTLNHRIQQFRADGTFVRAFGSHGDGVAQFNGPVGVCVDGANNIFVTDRDNHRVQQFRRDGTFVRAFGSSQGAAFGQFNLPQGVCVTADGALLVADYLNNRIQEFR
eukprot:gnl/Spiro4/18938_TR10095_c12_g34_i4.p1 gnl/Spiro4/18938_TR10095_c12_g34~~gnl/Spiro4/18938_TR10095_c12_g34_i4.p1  ORF type:complete len:306 (-),score=78.39 gnl/Spiro4/18938_TR10095_c12_g34_i4:211-1128(-)